MDGYKNIEINNFRGIDHLKIDDLSRVNVFLGQNNSGKSSVLETIYLITGMSNPDMPQNLNRIRTKNLYANFSDISYLFHNMDIKIVPELQAEQFDGNCRSLRLNLTYTFEEQGMLSQVNGMNGGLPTSETKSFANTLEMSFETNDHGTVKQYHSSLTVKPDGIVLNKKIADGYLEKYQSIFLTSDLWGFNLYPEMDGEDFLEFDSLINIRPNQGNRSRGVEDPAIQEKIKDIINSLCK